ncbi:BF3164 family lipoprotein [Flavobacterium undicola]|uniref:BF3164 family lipoprotein n=1 Tax=Flavobacterium undicola TaxID=1932779 RepID=UPI0013780F64|nr:BF3164 family lipoprotein [Flavobacterium undicola]MBA0884777.1 hypothetical protein [Flavobacterium undicola]
MKTFLVLIAALFLGACGKETQIVISDTIKTFSEFPKEEKIELKNLVEFKFGNPKKIIVSDSTLIFANRVSGQEYHLFNYSLMTHQFSKPYLAKGRESGEVLGMSNIGINNNHLWINDFSGQKIMILKKDKAIAEASASEYIEYPLSHRFYEINLIDNLKCIATGSETSKFKIQIIDLPTGKITEEFGQFKSYPENYPLRVITKASLTHPLLKPTKDKLVLAYIHTDVVEIFDLKTKKSFSIQGPEMFDSEFTAKENQWFENEKTRVTFISGATTNKYIYLLYSGKKFSEKKAYSGKYIYVYDWDLNPVKKITLDKEVSHITIAKDGKRLYTYDKETGYIVYATIN